MNVDINLLAVFVCVVFSIVLGSLWYGPLFGKKWEEIIGATDMDIEKRKEMQKKAMPLYAVQFVLSFVQVYILAQYINILSWIDISGVVNAFFIWVAFIVPTIAGAAMWNNNSNRIKWAQFGIQAGYQFIFFIVSGFILCVWK